MQVIRTAEACPRPPEGCAVTIGFFDGVHVGHQMLVGEVRRLAAELGARTAVVTFDPHPASVVRPESAPALLTDVEQRLELLGATGIDYTYLVRFDEERSRESPESFVREVLVECLGARAVVVGEDFHFGHERRGDVALLRAMGREHGFEVDGMPLVASGSRGARPVSSTAIRRALAEGRLDAANRMLGRPHEVRGVVCHGDGRGGKELGFPTANVAVPDTIRLPADGVYAGWYTRPDGTRLPTAISLGRRPQFYEDAELSLLEAHVVDAEGLDLYDEPARVQFTRLLRPQRRFDSVEALIGQIRLDVVATREALGVGSPSA